MHVRVRLGGREAYVALPSRLSRIEALRWRLVDKFDVDAGRQRLFYGGKLLEDGYTLHDYGVKLNDVIQLVPREGEPSEPAGSEPEPESESAANEEPRQIKEDYDSMFFRVGDLVDIREERGSWLEAKIVRVLRIIDESLNSDFLKLVDLRNSLTNSCQAKKSPSKKDTRNNFKNTALTKSPRDRKTSELTNGSPKEMKNKKVTTPKSGIKKYFGNVESSPENTKMNKNSNEMEKSQTNHENSETAESNNFEKIKQLEEKLLSFEVQLYDDEIKLECKLSEIRPRARNEVNIDDVEVNQCIMLNHNMEELHQIGYWFDFTVHSITKMRKHLELLGALHQGPDLFINDTKIKCTQKIFSIEQTIPLQKRTEEYENIMITETEKRKRPYHCTKCRDVENVLCRECGCNVCAKKSQPDKIILCDECNNGFHLFCLNPPLEQLPTGDWYCVDCKRNPEDVIAPGKAKQQRKNTDDKVGRDWGRGMACVGKSQSCSMPPNHFGPIPGIEVGMMWRFRIQLSETGVHRPPVSGIHGRDVDGAYSIVLSGGYEDDTDDGYEFTYTGSGGRDLSGNKRTADQSSDQTLTRENKALAKNCAVKEISEEGADAKDNWRDGRPVRVVRSYKMLKHFPDYAPKEGIRYDGIYKVVKYYPETGKSGFRVWKYLLRRDDPSPAPWEKNAKKYLIVYPDGYLEAEAEKQKQKQNLKGGQKRKKILKENNDDDMNFVEKKNKQSKGRSECDSPPPKKRKLRSSISTTDEKESDLDKKKSLLTPKQKRKTIEKVSPTAKSNPFTIAAKKNKRNSKTNVDENSEPEKSLDMNLFENDVVNKKLWDECITCLKASGKQSFINKVTELFMCIICQDVAAHPITTNCGHNFCNGCLKLAFKSTESKLCSYCRADLSNQEMVINEHLQSALRVLLPGYDAGKK